MQIRRKVLGRTKQEVRDKLKALLAELDAGALVGVVHRGARGG